MSLFGSSGIRATFNEDLLSLTLKVGLALGYNYPRVLVGRDSRTSSVALENVLAAGILAAGAECFCAGMVPTPTVALAARNFDAGAMITASHNPPRYNGIKLLNPDGSAFDLIQQQQLEEILSSDSLVTAPWSEIKSVTEYPGAIAQHRSRIRQDIPGNLHLKVVVDPAGGAASLVTPGLLEELGCEVIAINSNPTGFFPRESEPTEANLKHLMEITKKAGAGIGIAHDGDADRVVVIDEKGRYLSGDKLLIILARDLDVNKVVTTVDTSMVLEEMGFETLRTKVGDSFVSSEMKTKKGFQFGGEPSGAWIFPDISLCPDGVYAAARIAAIACREKLSVLADEIPQFPMLRTSIDSKDIPVSQLLSRLNPLNPRAVSDIDGLKLSFDDGWVLVRASGTEPKIRITVEARDETRLRQLHDESLRLLKGGEKS